MTACTAPTKGDSTVAMTNNALALKVVSYGTKVAELTATKLDFTLPFTFDFSQVNNLNFVFKNTCGEDISVEIYAKGDKLVKIDETIVFAYETYEYSLNHVYAKVAAAGGDIDGLIFRFPNYIIDSDGKAIALPTRSMEVKSIHYSLK